LREWMIPYWALMLVLACLPALAIRKALRSRRRRQPGLCPACGYDLRATPGRCPECGAVSA
jgi:predicted amidophosphoribosyltransferase